MKKKIKKKRGKFSRRKLIILGVILGLFLIIGIIFFSIYVYNKTLQRNINNHYNTFVVTVKKTGLLNKDLKVIGEVNNNFQLTLDKKSKKKYYKVLGTDFYIYYEDVKPIKKIDKDKVDDRYLVFNKNIKTSKKVSLYDNGKMVLELDKGINLPIQFIKDDYYNVYYLDKLLQVKKNKNIKEVDSKNTDSVEANHISVIYYENINEKCDNYNCVMTSSVKEQISKLLESGFYPITITEYKEYLNGNIHFKDKPILITTASRNDYVKNINTELNTHIEVVSDSIGLKFNSTNKTSNRESNREQIDRYQIKSYSTVDNIIKMANGEVVVEEEPKPVVTKSSEQGIAVLNYHFFYDPNLGEVCNEGICITVQKFREHLDYLKNNGFRTLKMREFVSWMYGEISLPEKSVLITIDDGAMGTGKHNGNKLIPLLEEYKMNATLFLITGWWDISNYISPYLDIQSHTNDMHQYGTCGRGQINCYSYEQDVADLQQSVNVIGNKDSFCFPFYYYSDKSLQAVKDVGFKVAFVGGSRKATRADNKYLVPRYPIHSNISLNQFINMVN